MPSSLLNSAASRRKSTVCMALKEDEPSLAVVGVTGVFGQEFLQVLYNRDFPYRSIRMLASRRSAGRNLIFEDREYKIEELLPESFDGIDITLFSFELLDDYLPDGGHTASTSC